MSAFGRQHPYRFGRAFLLATVIVVIGSWLFPVQWLRIFGRSVEVTEVAETDGERWIRLIPVENLGSDPNLVPERTLFGTEPEDGPSTDHRPLVERQEWSFDPTTAWSASSGEAEPLAPTLADSVLLRREFLNSLRLGNWDAVFAMLDTTQAGRAREQFRETDRWVNRVLGPVWSAQGFARRQADLWYRVVGEVEAEGSH